MPKNFRSVSADYMLYLIRNNCDNGGIFIECDSVIRMDTENYTFHFCQWGVITAESMEYKPEKPHTNYKTQDNRFNTLFNALIYRAKNHIMVTNQFFTM